MKQLGPEHFKQMPWKNGGGFTTELFLIPSDGVATFNFRLSSASIDKNGPFSPFPGIDRTLILLAGNGCDLNFKKGARKITKLFSPFYFQGEEVPDCHLINGPVIDFNVMVGRDWGQAKIEIVQEKSEIRCEAENVFIYHHPDQSLTILEQGDVWSSENKKNLIVVRLKPI